MKHYNVTYKIPNPDISYTIEETYEQISLFLDAWEQCGGHYDHKNKVYMADDRAYAEFVITYHSDILWVSVSRDETQYQTTI